LVGPWGGGRGDGRGLEVIHINEYKFVE